MAGVFISFAREDERQVKKLANRLEEVGITHFYSPHHIKGGDDWEDALVHAMQQCEVVLIYGTGRWLEKKWCRAEFLAARLAKKQILIADASRGAFQKDPSLSRIQQMPFRSNDRSLVQAILERLEQLSDADTLYPFDPERMPYPGLKALDVADAGVFFGRKTETELVLGEITEASLNKAAAKLLVLYGPSGSGKSSVLRAGVLARLNRHKSAWDVFGPFVPGQDPLDELATAYRAAKAKIARLQADKRSSKTKVLPDTNWFVVAIDQLEEVFQQPEQVAINFAKLLVDLVRLPGVMVVATIRSDFMPAFQELDDLGGLWKGLPIDKFDLRRLREIVVGPAGRVKFSVDDDLIEALERDADTPDALPLVAFALSEIWRRAQLRTDRRLSLVDYAGVAVQEPGSNRLERILVERAAAALEAIDPEEERLDDLRAAFIPQLVDVRSGGEPVRRRSVASAFSPDALRLLNHLSGWEWRLITADMSKEGERTFEVAHEALLRRWPLLSQSIKEEASNLALILSIEREAHEWKEAGSQHEYLLRLSGQRLSDALSLSRSQIYSGRASNVAQYIAKCEELERRRFDEAQTLRREKIDSYDSSVEQEIRSLSERGNWSEAIRIGQDALLRSTDQLSRTEAQIASSIAQSRLSRSLRVGHFGLSAMAMIETSKLIVVAGANDCLYLYDLARPSRVWKSDPLGSWVLSLDVCSSSNHIVAGLENGEVVLLHLDAGTIVKRNQSEDSPVTVVKFAFGGQDVISAHRNGKVKVHSTQNLDNSSWIGRHVDSVTGLAFDAAGLTLATVSRDQVLELHSGAGYSKKVELSVSNAPLLGVCFDPSFRFVATWSSDGVVCLVSKSGSISARFQDERLKGAITALAFSVDGDQIVTGHADGAVAVWDRASPELKKLWWVSERAVRAVGFLEMGSEVVCLFADGRVVVLRRDMETPDFVSQLNAPAIAMAILQDENRAIAIDAGGHISELDFNRRASNLVPLQKLASTPRSAAAHLLLEVADEAMHGENPGQSDTKNPRKAWYEVWPMLREAGYGRFIEAHDGAILIGDAGSQTVSAVQLHPRMGLISEFDGAGAADCVRFLTTMGVVAELEANSLSLVRHCQLPEIADVACFVPGRRTVLFASPSSGAVREWDIEAGVQCQQFLPAAGRILGIAVSNDGTRAAFATGQSRVFVANLVAGVGKFVELPEHFAATGAISFSPTGGHLALAAFPGIVHIFETSRLVNGIRFEIDDHQLIRRLVWSPNSKALAVVLKGGGARFLRKRKRGWSTVDVKKINGDHIRHVAWNDESTELIVTTERSVQRVNAETGDVSQLFETDRRCIGAFYSVNGEVCRWNKHGSVKAFDDGTAESRKWKKVDLGLVQTGMAPTPTIEQKKVQFNAKENRIVAKLATGGTLLAHKGERVAWGKNEGAGAYWVERLDRALEIGRVREEGIIRTIIKERAGASIVEFSADGRLAAIAYAAGNVEIIDNDAGVSLYSLRPRPSVVVGIKFSDLVDAVILLYADRQVARIETDLIGRRGDALRETLETICIVDHNPTPESSELRLGGSYG